MITYERSCSIVQQPTNLGEPVAQDWSHVLERRHPYKYQERPTYWYSPISNIVILPDGTKRSVPTGTKLIPLLDQIASYTTKKYSKQVATLYIVAGKTRKPRPLQQEWFDIPCANGLEALQWKRTLYFWGSLQAKYERDGFTVHIYGTGNYFGDERDLEAMYEAFNALEPKLERKFNAEGYKLLGDTPAQTGKELLLISLPESKPDKKIQYPHLIGKPAEIVYHNLRYQGRVETLPQKREKLENGVYIPDARFMYASCLSHPPVGPVYHDKQNEFLGVRTKAGKWYPACPGFYNVTVQVPDNWHHIGLIKSGKSKSPVDDRGYYPNDPGVVFTNWVTAAEVTLLLNNDWPFHINERIIWPETEKTTDPLAVWLRQLRNFRAEIEQKLKEHGDNCHCPHCKVLKLHKDMIRDIVIKSTGSFHQYMTYEKRFTPRIPGEKLHLPVTPHEIIRSNAKGIEWVEAIPLSEYRRKWMHPEWSATAWGRARTRVTAFALRQPYEDVVAILTDCIVCASKPDWLESEDTGDPGCFREKGYIEGPLYWPKDMNDVNALIAKHKPTIGNDDLDEQEMED
jgi:hypothetical protein